ASKKPRRRWPARLPAAQREEVLRSGFLLAARRSAGRMLGLELLPLLPAGLLLRFHRGHLRLLRRGQHVVDLCADVGHLLHASGGGGAFGLGQRSGGGLVAGVGRVHRLERLPLLAQRLPLAFVLLEVALHDLLDAGFLGVAQVELAERHHAVVAAVVAPAAVVGGALRRDREAADGQRRAEGQTENEVLAHGCRLLSWGEWNVWLLDDIRMCMFFAGA